MACLYLCVCIHAFSHTVSVCVCVCVCVGARVYASAVPVQNTRGNQWMEGTAH